MAMKCGVDLIFIPDFEERIQRSGKGFLKKAFLERELENTEASHLAGVFAAKEAVLKALNLPVGSWLETEVVYQDNGKPEIRVSGKKVPNSDLGISHTGDYAIAVFVKER